ncbi:TrlF family AAA-like ATPase [uncultured Spirosoma sp.]|uniref:TrlF family AAA-like ATPase n=1 Tax=uncultured Spirosoma sp. TaxID=278208 RepID=UPI00258AAB51|nr:AAA family ATPase [uncultured Spirosoma sp.]
MNEMYKGADYRKTDLQLHSPRDRGWKGSHPELKQADKETNLDQIRRKWANDFIDNCVEKGVQLASLTDHHEGIYCWYVIEELKKRNSSIESSVDLWFMPGMELTCKDSAQALILFDSGLNKALFEKARNLLRLPTNCVEDNHQGIEVSLLDFNVDEVQGVLENDLELQGKFIILPNVTPKGHKTVLREGFHKRFKELPYVGGYLDAIYPDQLNDGDRRILEGQIPDWTSEKRGIITTSDARSADFSALGQFATWVKLAEPTAESLRQAMLAADSRILYVDPETPSLFVQSISVSGAEFLSLDEPVNVSHQFTSIIGGRGSGKSTLLEFIRYAIGQSAIDTGDSTWDPTHERRKNIIKYALSESTGTVELTIKKDGAEIILRRSRSSQDRITMRVQGEEQVISPGDARKLFAFQAYSQGELSHLGDDRAENRLFDLITDPQREIISQIGKRQQSIIGELRELLDQAIKGWQFEREHRKLRAQLMTLQAGIENTSQKLHSLPAGTQAILDDNSIVKSTNRWLEQVIDKHQTYTETLSTYLQENLSELESFLIADKVPTANESQQMAAILRQSVEETGDLLRTISAKNQEFEQQQTEIIIGWNKKKQEHEIAYNNALSQLSQHKADLDHLKKLESDKEIIEVQINDIYERIETLKPSLASLKEKGGHFIATQHELRRISSNGVQNLASLTDNLARAELYEKDDLSELWDSLNSLFAGSGVRTERLEKLLDKISSADPIANWWKFLDEVLSIFRWNTTGLRETEKRPSLSILDSTIDPGGLDRFCERLDVDRVNKAMKAAVKPRVRLLQKRGGTEIEFNQASQGEKATILLNVLMRQEGGPLLIDQPEEDLDNRIIGDIVTATRQAKAKKQLIFATHNANLVVNGDAELVLDLAAGKLNQIGAIDLEDMRTSITDTMEGGKQAFELRRRKYNF